MSRPKKIISQPFGGLGDWLLLSTLPRRLDEAGFDVYIHDGPFTQFRNSEIKDLVMRNPHIKGFSPEQPNAGLGIYADLWGKFCYEVRLRPSDPIAIMEEVNGLPPPYSHAPEIYPEMPPVQMNDNIIIVDPYSSSLPFTKDSVDPWVDFYTQHHYKGKQVIVVETPGYAAFHRALFGQPKIQVQTLTEYIGLLRSCFAFFGVESGGQMLAAAVKNSLRPELRVHALFSTRGYNQKFYRLPESHVLTDASAFVLQNDFAVDPGMLGFLHICETAAFADRARAAEAASKPAPVPQAADLLSMRQPGEIVYEQIAGIPDALDSGFPVQNLANHRLAAAANNALANQVS